MYYLCKCVTLICFRICLSIRSLKTFSVDRDIAEAPASQAKNSDLAVYMITLQPELKKKLHPGRSFQKCSVSVTLGRFHGNLRNKIKTFLKINSMKFVRMFLKFLKNS